MRRIKNWLSFSLNSNCREYRHNEIDRRQGLLTNKVTNEDAIGDGVDG